MNFYEHTLIARQNLSQKDVDIIEKKYEDLINKNYKVSLSTGYTLVSTAFINDLNMTSTKSVRDFKIRDFNLVKILSYTSCSKTFLPI